MNARRRRWNAGAPVWLAVAFLMLACHPASAAVPPGATWSEAYFRSSDGTRLHADVLRPAHLPAGARTPVVVWIGPSFNHSGGGLGGGFPTAIYDPTKSGPDVANSAFIRDGKPFERGYTVVVVDLRGFGGSAGCSDFFGPGERADAKAAVEWAASQPWSTGRVGLLGYSSTTIAALGALSERPRGLKAMALAVGTTALDQILMTNGVHYGTFLYAAAPAYSLDNFQPGTINDSAEYHQAWTGGLDPNCLAPGIQSLGTDPGSAFFRARDFSDRVAGAKVPILYAHGFFDVRLKAGLMQNFIPRLGRTPQMWLGQWGHTSPLAEPSGRNGWTAQIMALFDRHLALRKAPQPPANVVVQEGPSGRYRGERQWPPRDLRRITVPVAAGTYLDLPGNNGEPRAAGDLERPTAAVAVTGLGAWTKSAPLATEAHLAGIPAVRVDAAGAKNAVVVALLYDIKPDGTALLVSRGATRLHRGRARFDLQPQDWRFAESHRVGLLLTGADGEIYMPLDRSLLPVRVQGGTLSLPVLKRKRTEFLDGKASPELLAKQPITVP